MFDETKKYENCGHFFFKKGDRLAEVSQGVPELPGVYYIVCMRNNKIELMYIGKSGTIKQTGEFKEQYLKRRLNNKQDGMKRQDYFNRKMIEEAIYELDIYWFVTMDRRNNDLPGYVEGILIQRFFEVYGKLPLWNKDF